MKRRNLVSLCGTIGLASLAGCQAFGSRLKKEPPRFEEVALSGASEATVGESVSLSVSVTNAGGQAGDFEDSLTVADATESTTEFGIDEVPASESRTVEIGPYTFGYAGDYRFELADAGATHTVSVTPRSLRGNQGFGIPDGPGVSVADLSSDASLFYDGTTGRGVLSPEDGAVFVAFRVTFTNHGGRGIPVGSASFDVQDGDIVTGVGDDASSSESLEAVAGLDGEPFPEGAVGPGETRSGWLLAEVPRERVAEGVEVAWNRGEPGSESRYRSETTTGSDHHSPPESRWTFDSAEPPEFGVADLSLLDATEFGSSVTATATVQNVGPVSSTYRGVLERRDADETDGSDQTDQIHQTDQTAWTRLETFERELSPGASATVTAEVSASAVGLSEYRLRPGSATEEVTVRPAERALGEAFTTPAGAAIQVEVGTDAFDGLLSSYIYEDLSNQTVRAGSGHTFAFVQVTVENTASESVAFPDRRAFSVVADGTAHSVFHSSSSADVTFLSPVDGPWYAPDSASEPGATHSGWLVFQVPKDVTVADLTVRWSPTDDEVATWSK